MRHYDLADRTRNRFTGQADIVPSRRLDVQRRRPASSRTTSATASSGCRIPTGRTFSLAADFHQPNGLGAGGSYNYERYAGLQRSHEGDSSDAQFDDPLRDWTADSTETVHYFSIYADAAAHRPQHRDARLATTSATPQANYLYTIPAGSPIPTPNQLPDVFNKLQQLHLDVRHRLSSRLAATFSYLYEPLRVYDFAFDPERGQQHRAAELAGPGLRLSAVHRAFGGVRPAYFW